MDKLRDNPGVSHSDNPRALLTPAMRQVLERMARRGAVPLHALSPEQARQAYEAGAGVLDIAAPALARVETLQLPVRGGATLSARLYADQTTDGGATLPLLVYFHGGGFTIGSLETHDTLCRHLARLGHCAVVSVDYRLAPEHRFPTAALDAWDALCWLREQADLVGVDGARLAVGGDSAGGTLSAVCALMARDAGLPLALQLLFYPGTCAWQDTASHHRFGHGFLIEKAHIDWFFGHYLRGDADRADWRFAPLLAEDVDGVAPAWLGLAECDPLVDEGLAYADRLRMAGVSVELELYRGVVHDFIKMGRAIPEALQAHADAGRALRHAFGQPPTLAR